LTPATSGELLRDQRVTSSENLRAALEALPLRVDDVRVDSAHVELASYPDGPRPTSTVRLGGDGATGFGEHVGWTDAEHLAFRNAADSLSRGSWKLGAWTSALATFSPYDRAALEAAAIDLALRQSRTSLLQLAGVTPRPVRYVVSFARTDDPIAEAGRVSPETLELKVDADPAWTDRIWRDLASLGRVAIVDFKLGGETTDHERACRHLPDAWIEDPRPAAAAWSASLQRRVSADAAVTSVAALDALAPVPAAVNVKPARMGSVLEAIACLEHCRRRGQPCYIGGMFEVGVARQQSLVLAALACPDGPNDIAPLFASQPRPSRLLADADAPGFGGDPAGLAG